MDFTFSAMLLGNSPLSHMRVKTSFHIRFTGWKKRTLSTFAMYNEDLKESVSRKQAKMIYPLTPS